MKITPLDVDQQQFARVFRGCDPGEVHNFLDLVSREMEELVRENNQLKESLRRQEESLQDFKLQETSLREALVSAGRLTDEIRERARKEAELVRAEAELQAEKILQRSHDEVVKLSDECRALRQQKARLMAELRAVLDGHQRLMATYEDVPAPRAGRTLAPNGRGLEDFDP